MTYNIPSYASKSVPESQHIQIQVVLEYHWTSTRDLIADVSATRIISDDSQGPSGEQSKNLGQVSLKSIVDSLGAKGFELEADHRLSFLNTQKSMYVYIGRASDKDILDSFCLPQEAFEASAEDLWTLTLMVRQPGSGLSGQKKAPVAQQASFGVPTTPQGNAEEEFEDK